MATFTIDLLTSQLYLFNGDFTGSGGTPTSGTTLPADYYTQTCADDLFVHLTGNETISGIKTFDTCALSSVCFRAPTLCATTLATAPTIYASTLNCGGIVCGDSCVTTPISCATTRVQSPFVCATSCVQSPLVIGSSTVYSPLISGVTTCSINYYGSTAIINAVCSDNVLSCVYDADDGFKICEGGGISKLHIDNICARNCILSPWAKICTISTQHLQSSGYTGSGFQDSGFLVCSNDSQNSLIVGDNGVFRDNLRVFEYEISKTRVSNGQWLISPAAAVADTNLINNLYFDVTGDNPFQIDDKIEAKSNYSLNAYTIQYHITGITGQSVYVFEITSTGIEEIEGMTFAKVGTFVSGQTMGFMVLDPASAEGTNMKIYSGIGSDDPTNSNAILVNGDLPSIELPNGRYTEGSGTILKNSYILGNLFAESGLMGGLILTTEGLLANDDLSDTSVHLNSNTGSLLGINDCRENTIEITGKNANTLDELLGGVEINFPFSTYDDNYVFNYTTTGITYLYIQSDDTGIGNSGIQLASNYNSNYDWYTGSDVGQLNIDGRLKIYSNEYYMRDIEIRLYFISSTKNILLKKVKFDYIGTTTNPQYIDFNSIINNLTDTYNYIKIEYNGFYGRLYTVIEKFNEYSNAKKTEIANNGTTILNSENYFRINTDDTYFFDVCGCARIQGLDDLTIGSCQKLSNTTLKVLSNSEYCAGVEAYGCSQGTGYIYAGQSASYGGGIYYEGDTNTFACNGTTDTITLYRRSNNINYAVMKYSVSCDDVCFGGNVGINYAPNPTYNLAVNDSILISKGDASACQMMYLSNYSEGTSHAAITYNHFTHYYTAGMDGYYNAFKIQGGCNFTTTSCNVALSSYCSGLYTGMGTPTALYRLHVVGNGTAPTVMYVCQPVGVCGISLVVDQCEGYYANTCFVCFKIDGTSCGAIVHNCTGTLGFSQTSDCRLKCCISDFNTDSLSLINQIEVKNFKMIDQPPIQSCKTGVIAQQVKGIIPEMVGEIENPEDMYSIGYEPLHPHYIKAFQELTCCVCELNNCIKKLEK